MEKEQWCHETHLQLAFCCRSTRNDHLAAQGDLCHQTFYHWNLHLLANTRMCTLLYHFNWHGWINHNNGSCSRMKRLHDALNVLLYLNKNLSNLLHIKQRVGGCSSRLLHNMFKLRSELNNASYSNAFLLKMKVTTLELISQEEIRSGQNILQQEISCYLCFVYEKALLKRENCKLTASGILAKLKYGW